MSHRFGRVPPFARFGRVPPFARLGRRGGSPARRPQAAIGRPKAA
jgi:hypothetical protein